MRLTKALIVYQFTFHTTDLLPMRPQSPCLNLMQNENIDAYDVSVRTNSKSRTMKFAEFDKMYERRAAEKHGRTSMR